MQRAGQRTGQRRVGQRQIRERNSSVHGIYRLLVSLLALRGQFARLRASVALLGLLARYAP